MYQYPSNSQLRTIFLLDNHILTLFLQGDITTQNQVDLNRFVDF